MSWKETIREAWNVRRTSIGLSALRVFVGILWLNSGVGMLLSAKYVAGFPATMGKFAAGNPNGWYVDFLNTQVLPNASSWAYFIAWTEVLVGLALVLGAFTNAAAIGAFLMNMNFFFAASHTSASTWTVNLIMAAVALTVVFSPGAKFLSLDHAVSRFVAKRLPKLKRVAHAVLVKPIPARLAAS